MKSVGYGAWLRRGVLALPLLFLAFFYVYPLSVILRQSLAPEGVWALETWQPLWRDGYFLRRLWFTVWQALLSTALTLLLALPGAYLFAAYTFRGKTTLRALSALPFVLPTVVVASAFSALVGPQGVINQALMRLGGWTSPPLQLEQTLGIILLAHVFYNYSVALRLISVYWQNLNPHLAQAAQLLGATPWRAFWHITLPLLRPAIQAAAALIFIFTFTSFGVVVILGGPRFATLEVEIYRQAVNLFNLPVAAALSLIQIIFTLGLLLAYTRTQTHLARTRSLVAAPAVARRPTTPGERLFMAANLGLMAGLLGAPLLALVWRSLHTAQGWSLVFYQELFINRRDSLFFAPPIEAVVNSTGLALITTALAVSLGLLGAAWLGREEPGSTAAARWRRRGRQGLDALLMLPLATSAVTLGFGFILALNRPPLNLRTSAALIPIAHTLVAMPFVIRAALPALRRINPGLREAALMLGASPAQVWRTVDWPLIRPALLVGAVFAFTVSMGEFGATVFIARPDTPTLPVAIYRFLSQPGALNYGQALAMSSLLLLVCAVGFGLIERLRLGDEGEF